MRFQVVIRYYDEEGKEHAESVPLTSLTEGDAQFQRSIQEEVAKKEHGARFIEARLEAL